MRSLPWITIFLVICEAICQDFHSWLRHSWKSLANHLTRDQKILMHGDSCIILYLLYNLAAEESARWLLVANYANPVYGVATICHQVRCLRWGHPSLFHTATPLLILHKMFCMRDISYRLTWMKFINMLSVYAQSGTHKHVNWLIIAVLT